VATAVPRDGLPVVAALPATRGAPVERRLVGMDTSDLRALADARAGIVGATLRTQKQKTELQSLETGAPGEGTTYLKVEKPRFLFLEGSAGAIVAPIVATAALPDAPAVLAGTSAARAASSTDRSAVGASAPTVSACSFAASTSLSDGGGGFHLSRGAPRRSPLPPPPLTTNFPGSSGERVPAARTADTPRPVATGAPAAGFSSLSYAQPAPAPVAAWRG
jgi:hypothetical protein